MFEEMRALAMFADAGSVHAAARRLGLTQSAVTRQIQRLENELGTTLLDRRIKPPLLTASGRMVVERCRTVLRDVADLKVTAAPASAPVGEFRVGVGYVLADDELAECVHAVGEAFPGVSLSIRTDWHPALIDMVRESQLDVAVIPCRPDLAFPADVSRTVLGIEPLVVAVSTSKDIGARPTLERIAALKWIVKPRGTGTREVLEGALARHGLALEPHSVVRDENLQLSLVARGLGAGLVTRRSIDRHPCKSKLRTLSVKGLDTRLQLVMIRYRYLGNLAAAADILERRLRGCYGDKPGTRRR